MNTKSREKLDKLLKDIKGEFNNWFGVVFEITDGLGDKYLDLDLTNEVAEKVWEKLEPKLREIYYQGRKNKGNELEAKVLDPMIKFRMVLDNMKDAINEAVYEK